MKTLFLLRSDTVLKEMSNFQETFGGVNGFEELRKIVKQGAEFAKDVASIMQERADMEMTYAKGINRLGAKMTKLAANSTGSLAEGWKATAVEMEQESELHKQVSRALMEDIAKPLKLWVEAQQKSRRPIESMVEKAVRQLADRRNEEYKSKKNAFTIARELEKLEEQLAEARAGRGKYTDRDVTKLEKKCRQQYDSVQKCDKEYSEACQKAEAARQEWDLSILKGAAQMQVLEEDRINKMQELLNVFNTNISQQGPQLMQICEKLDKSVSRVDLKEDLQSLMKERGTGPPQPHQILFDCYAEDMTLNMNLNRRKQALKSYLFYIQSALERERKGKEGVEKLMQVYKDRPDFADQDAQDDAKNRLMQVTFTLNFLEASHSKINSALSVISGESKTNHRFGPYIESVRDKQGIPTTTLRLPLNMALESGSTYLASSNSTGSVQLSPPTSPYDQDFDPEDFSDDDDDFDNNYEYPSSVGSYNQCRVIYEYSANATDELDIKPGDIINIYNRQPDGWWQGELNGKVGIFPANYVEEI